MLPVDIAALQEQLLRLGAEVRFLPVEVSDATIAGERLTAYFQDLEASRWAFERTTAMVRSDATQIVALDRFLEDSEREGVRRIVRLLREWAPRLAELRAAETDSMVLAFPAMFRPYNDVVTRCVRTLLDSAAKLEARLAQELEEDAEADAWGARNRPLVKPDETTVPWDEVRAKLPG